MPEETEKLKEFSEVVKECETFICDGSCNNDSDVCVHVFAWKCNCGNKVEGFREDILDMNPERFEQECWECMNEEFGMDRSEGIANGLIDPYF